MTRAQGPTPAPEAPGELEEVALAKMEDVTGGCAGAGGAAAPTDPNQAAQQPAAGGKPGAGNILNSVMGIVNSLGGMAGGGGGQG